MSLEHDNYEALLRRIGELEAVIDYATEAIDDADPKVQLAARLRMAAIVSEDPMMRKSAMRGLHDAMVKLIPAAAKPEESR